MEGIKTRRVYDQEFKREAIRLVLEGGRPALVVAENLGINVNNLYKWIRQFKADPEDSFPGKGRLKPEDEKLRRLEKELADVKEERDILKKAVAIFSRVKR
ncbi:transposase [Bacteroidota bacterium]